MYVYVCIKMYLKTMCILSCHQDRNLKKIARKHVFRLGDLRTFFLRKEEMRKNRKRDFNEVKIKEYKIENPVVPAF